MIISRLVLKNWRNFRGIDVPLKERVFVIGPNASGKSNMLDALRFLRDIAKPGGGLQRAITQRGGISKVRCLAARKEPDIEVAVELSENGSEVTWKYEIGITQQIRGYRQPILRYEKVSQGNSQIMQRPDEDDRRDEVRLPYGLYLSDSQAAARIWEPGEPSSAALHTTGMVPRLCPKMRRTK